MQAKITHTFSNPLWKDKSGGWSFVTVPKNISKEIRGQLQWQEEGWGRMKVTAIIEQLEWKTSIWFDTKMDTYILPVKAEVRKKLSLKEGNLLNVTILV